jgi:hypothetical protein
MQTTDSVLKVISYKKRNVEKEIMKTGGVNNKSRWRKKTGAKTLSRGENKIQIDAQQKL